MDEKTLNDLLECSVCLDRLEDSKVLACQHTFCTQCLEVIKNHTNNRIKAFNSNSKIFLGYIKKSKRA